MTTTLPGMRRIALSIALGLALAATACETGGGAADPGFCTDVRQMKTAVSQFRSAVEGGQVDAVRLQSTQLVTTLNDRVPRAPGNVDGALGEYRDAYTRIEGLLAAKSYDPTKLSSKERDSVLKPKLGGDAEDDVEEFLRESCK